MESGKLGAYCLLQTTKTTIASSSRKGIYWNILGGMTIYFLATCERERALVLIMPDSRCTGDTHGVINIRALSRAQQCAAWNTTQACSGAALPPRWVLDTGQKFLSLPPREAPLMALPASKNGHLWLVEPTSHTCYQVKGDWENKFHTPPPTDCEALGQLLHFPVSLFPHVENSKDNNTSCL